jgi:hypothetical protein
MSDGEDTFYFWDVKFSRCVYFSSRERGSELGLKNTFFTGFWCF